MSDPLAEKGYLDNLPTIPSGNPHRWLIRFDLNSAAVVLDTDVQISGDRSSGFVVSAEFTPSRLEVRPSSVVTVGERDIDMTALVAAAQETGERVFRMDDYLSIPPGQHPAHPGGDQ